MLTAPKQNWAAYEAAARAGDAHWLRSLMPAQRFAIYSDLFEIIRTGRDPSVNWQRVEESLWQEKVAQRLQAVAAFQKLDEYRRAESLRNRQEF